MGLGWWRGLGLNPKRRNWTQNGAGKKREKDKSKGFVNGGTEMRGSITEMNQSDPKNDPK